MIPKKSEKMTSNLEKILNDIENKPYNFYPIENYIFNKKEKIKVEISYLKEEQLYFARINFYDGNKKYLSNLIDFLNKNYDFKMMDSYSLGYIKLTRNQNKKETKSLEKHNKNPSEYFRYSSVGNSDVNSVGYAEKKNKKTLLNYETLVNKVLKKIRKQERHGINKEINLELPDRIFLTYEMEIFKNRIRRIEELCAANNILLELKESKEKTKNFLFYIALLSETN